MTFLLALSLIPVFRIKKMIGGLNRRLLIGPDDVCLQGTNFKIFTDALGYQSDLMLMKNVQSFYPQKAKYLWEIPKWFFFVPWGGLIARRVFLCLKFLRFLFLYDHFIILWRESFLPLSLDLLVFKMAGKKSYRGFFGDDIRYRPIQYELDQLILGHTPPWYQTRKDACYGTGEFLRSFWTCWILNTLKIPIMSCKGSVTFMSRPIWNGFNYIKDFIEKPKKTNEVPLIFCAPSNRKGKGLDFALKALEDMRLEGVSFELIVLENVPHKKVLACLEKADIVIDQPSNVIARLSSEAMAYGCIPVTNCAPTYNIRSKNSPPVIEYRWTQDAFKDTLAPFLQSPQKRQELMDKTLDYYKTHNSFDACLSRVRDFLSENKESSFLLRPFDHQKEKLMACSENTFQRSIIWLFF